MSDSDRISQRMDATISRLKFEADNIKLKLDLFKTLSNIPVEKWTAEHKVVLEALERW